MVYGGARPVTALRDASLRVWPGELVAILGRSGSGKTTLLSILGLLESPTSGTLSLVGQSVLTSSDRVRTRLRARHIGFVFQSFHLVPELTATENVALPLTYQRGRRRGRYARAEDLLESMGMRHRMRARAATLSGGEQQRVAMARALVTEPDLILADEPTGNLDSQTEQTVISLLRRIADEGRAVIVVTHNSQVATEASRLFHMADGVLVPVGGTPG
ncbi:MAG: ABC transporter ATP-binding protein [Bifidobacteriaceae bacterium]|nr:ABC transporter ATP-binding protein [Bifidobacteriaceae bacterium]